VGISGCGETGVLSSGYCTLPCANKPPWEEGTGVGGTPTLFCVEEGHGCGGGGPNKPRGEKTFITVGFFYNGGHHKKMVPSFGIFMTPSF